MRTTRPTRNSDRLLCALAVLCFMVQQLWAPVHCVLHEHEIGDAGLAQSGVENCPTHAGHDHFHGDEIVEGGQEDAEHEPHPIEDELARVVEKLAQRVSGGQKVSPSVGIEVCEVVGTCVDPQEVGMAWYELHSAHGPPDRRGHGPRGPPVIV
ncbi:MAG: hypothetical protein P1V35_03595 [Planctomycetota bacterium]|nr:hypothetical protein [Planctomycetota bacterium]